MLNKNDKQKSSQYSSISKSLEKLLLDQRSSYSVIIPSEIKIEEDEINKNTIIFVILF
jgi:hypothetical protein